MRERRSRADRKPSAHLVAMSDAFADRAKTARESLRNQQDVRDRVQVDDDHLFSGFEGCQQLLASGVDVALLADRPISGPCTWRPVWRPESMCLPKSRWPSMRRACDACWPRGKRPGRSS